MKAKTYVVFGNDHSQSMYTIAGAALRDYNANVDAIKGAATREMLDTIVSVISFGKERNQVARDITVSNPHVLHPMTSWPAVANTPLWDAVGNGIELMESVPDYNDPTVAFLFMYTTDGEEYGSQKYSKAKLAAKIRELSVQERWTFVFRVPKGKRDTLDGLGIPEGNIQEWETTAAGMAASTASTAAAVDKFYATRSAGLRSSNVFYADAAQVNTAALVDITNHVSLYVVPDEFNGKWIRDFILTKRMQYLKGAAFYQLTKTESKVSHTKLILVRDRTTKKIYGGKEARQMIGMPTDRNARLHPGDHGNFDIFIQSESINRYLVAGTGVVYWEEKGTQFTQAELDRFNGVAKAVPAVDPKQVELPAVPVSTKPTPSPIKPTPAVPRVNGQPVKYFTSRSEARKAGSVKDAKDFGLTSTLRWFVFI